MVATSDSVVGQDLRDKMSVITNNWEELFQYVEKYMHVGDVTRLEFISLLYLIYFEIKFANVMTT